MLHLKAQVNKEFGIFTFGELTRSISTGSALSPHQRLTEIIELARLATSQRARDTFYPYYRAYFEQKVPRPVDHFPRSTYDDWSEPGGGLLVGSPQQITEKLIEIQRTLGNSRYMAQVGLGGLPFAKTARSIELLATEIMPAVNRELMGTSTA